MEEDVMESTEVDTPESSVEVSEEPSGETYAVKVDGVDQEVSLEELRDGYQRQSDYTRKTQELASERRRLQQAEAIVEPDPSRGGHGGWWRKHGCRQAHGDKRGQDYELQGILVWSR